ncbi:hypothetical protein GCM10010978_25930 [Compostibacillus humi]|uniref:Uncharacterized protein n=1 Tax=Compostibacillus humi TaxID=1245525 RepID=A0A8J2TNA9_9BACI|nr:hypothetical protein GCM10010978_25930 [Compostibacillus humi]
MKSIWWMILPFIFLSGCLSVYGESDVLELKLAHNQSLDHPVHISLAKFGELLEEKSDGTIKAKLFPNGQLGSEREVIELTQAGTVDFAKVSASALEGFASDYSIFSLPYVFEDYDTFQKVMNQKEVTDHLYYHTEDIGFIGLTYYNAGMRNLYTKDLDINDVSEMSGLMVQVQPSKTSVQMIESMGAIPTDGLRRSIYRFTSRGH